MADSFFVRVKSDTIDDGYTRKFKIAARPGLHPALDGEFRPALPRDRQALKHPSMTADMYAERTLALVASNVKTWTAGVPVSREAVDILEPTLFQDLLDFVLGYSWMAAEADQKN